MNRAVVMSPGLRMRLLASRLLQLLGWPGLVGLALWVLAVGLGLVSWSARRSADVAPTVRVEAVRRDPPLPAAEKLAAPRKSLPRRAEIQALLSQVQQAAVASGLGWPAAEYRLSPATESDAASLEVRCTLKGSYPQLRGLLTRLLADVPGLSVRDLSISRAGSDVPEVEAKLVLAIFLQGESVAPLGKAAP